MIIVEQKNKTNGNLSSKIRISNLKGKFQMSIVKFFAPYIPIAKARGLTTRNDNLKMPKVYKILINSY